VRVCLGDLPRESPALLFLLSFLAWHGGAELIPFSCGSDCPSPQQGGGASQAKVAEKLTRRERPTDRGAARSLGGSGEREKGAVAALDERGIGDEVV
jgi:hypothetical protein